MAFNRVILPSAAGKNGQQFAQFLGVSENEELDLTNMQSILFDRLYRLGAVRNLDGSRAHRRRASQRRAEKNRRTRARHRRAEARRRTAQARRTRRNVRQGV